MLNSPSVYFVLISMLYSIFINILFFSKKHIETYETKIYGVMIFSNSIGLTIELLSIIIANSFSLSSSHIPYISAKLFLMYLTLFAFLFTAYVIFVVALRVNDKELSQNQKMIKRVMEFLYVFFCFLIVILPINIFYEDHIMYSYGASVNVVYICTTLCAIICFASVLKYGRLVSKKKLLPLIIFMIGMGIVTIIQKINPSLTLATTMETLLMLIMYNTIENPDMKMIEQLEAARDQANKANQAKTEFLSSMSHEIRTPLNAIVGFSDYIMTSETLEEAKENANDIINASNTLLEIVNGILDISKIEAGKLEIINSKYNARSTFEGLAKLITPKMNEKGLDFTYYIAPDIPETLFGDHANIKKIVTNLLSNAYKYTDKGFVRYEVNCINSANITNANITKLIITVEDSGRGIKQESVDKLFTKFQRLDEDKNTTIEGTGLGLAITKQLIELMGGKILVHTVYGEGSKFTVVLNQRIEYTPVEEVHQEIKTTLDLHNKKILIVDDNLLNIKVATKILERYNANNIKSFDNGFDCIKDIEDGSLYDIILMDDMMPKMSGIETFKKLREIPGFHMPVVILTANAITGMKEKYMSEGFDEYLAKPIEKDELIRVCNTIFDKYNILPSEKVEHLEKTEELEIIGEDTEEEPTIEKNSSDAYLRTNGVDLDKALEFLGDMEMYNMTINDFLAEVEEKWQRINNYKTINDMSNYAIEVHSLKSDAKYLGFMSLANIAYQHELKSKENDSKFVDIHFQELSAAYNRALNIAKTYQNMIK